MKAILLLYCFIFILSCSKKPGDVNSHFIGSYSTESIITANEPVMYTKNSLITDSNFIKSYISRLSSWNPYYMNEFSFGITTEPATKSVNIDFISSTEATVQYNNGGKKSYALKVDNNNAVFNRKDTTIFTKEIMSFGCTELTNKAILYKPSYNECSIISTSTGDKYLCKVSPIELVISDDGNLYLPLFTHFNGKSSVGVGDCTSYGKNVPMVFNSDIQSSLSETDTIVIQNKKWKLIKL